MIRTSAWLMRAALLLACAGAADAQRTFELMRDGRSIALPPTADPSAIVAAELAFAKLSREQGQWTGFRKTADKDAVMFVPGVVNAQSWLAKRADPPKSILWAPSRVFMACDGSYGVDIGHASYPNGRKGGYLTIWRRQDDGSYKWMLDWGLQQPVGGADDDMIDGKVADCAAPSRAPDASRPNRRDRPYKLPKKDTQRIATPPPADGEGQSTDGTLRWHWSTTADGGRALKVTMRYSDADLLVIDENIPAKPE